MLTDYCDNTYAEIIKEIIRNGPTIKSSILL